MSTSRMTVKGQVTVPKKMRDVFGWEPQTEVQFELMPDGVKITRFPNTKSRGTSIVQRLRGKGNRKRTTDQILAMTRGEGQ
ncbi:MAG: AbrB family transcriptional regulator [Verrucomicrobiales bacterium]|jgi:antitoxin PrlF|nr:AbrB family transcriptional regulator [Verrucomicrobiales bacterium]